MTSDITLGSKCEQCGYIHPISQNGICTLSKTKNIKIEGDNYDFSEFIDKINNICISQIKMKNIKNIELFKKFTIIELTKVFEKYKED